MDQIPQTLGYPKFELILRGSRIPNNFNYAYVADSLVKLRGNINPDTYKSFEEYNATDALSTIVREILIHNRSSMVLPDIFKILPLTDKYVQENFEYLKSIAHVNRTILHIILDLMAIEAHYYQSMIEG